MVVKVEGLRGMTANGNGISLWSDENILELESADGSIILCVYLKQLVYFKRVYFTICELYL